MFEKQIFPEMLKKDSLYYSNISLSYFTTDFQFILFYFALLCFELGRPQSRVSIHITPVSNNWWFFWTLALIVAYLVMNDSCYRDIIKICNQVNWGFKENHMLNRLYDNTAWNCLQKKKRKKKGFQSVQSVDCCFFSHNSLSRIKPTGHCQICNFLVWQTDTLETKQFYFRNVAWSPYPVFITPSLVDLPQLL